MRVHGKHYRAAVATLEPRKLLSPREAVEKVKATAYAKFDESLDIAVRLGVDPKHADQIVRGTVSLPHGTGKKIRVLVIAQGDKAKEAEAAGADFVGIEYVQKIKDGWLDTDVIVATPDVMGQLGPLGKVLGPRGLMPNPKAGTVTMDVARAGQEPKAGENEVPYPPRPPPGHRPRPRSEEHTAELQSPCKLVHPLLLYKKKK